MSTAEMGAVHGAAVLIVVLEVVVIEFGFGHSASTAQKEESRQL